jgi:hypothetical protein
MTRSPSFRLSVLTRCVRIALYGSPYVSWVPVGSNG